MQPPILILVTPQLGENIGAAARAAKNFGLSELRLVSPRGGWPHPRHTRKAMDMASGAGEIVEAAQAYHVTAEAVADLHVTYAATARPRYMIKPVLTPREAAARMAIECAEGKKVGILFGPERTGLVNEDVQRADVIVTIPTNPDYSSLNVAQSLVLLCYEWFQARHLPESQGIPYGKAIPATKEEVEGLLNHLVGELDQHDYFKAADKKPGIVQNIANLFIRAGLTDQEVRTLRGIIRALVWRGEY